MCGELLGVGADQDTTGSSTMFPLSSTFLPGMVVPGRRVMVPSFPLHGELSPIEMSGVFRLHQNPDARVGDSDEG